MLSRFISNPCRHLRLLSRAFSPPIPSNPPLSNHPKFTFNHFIYRHFSTNNSNNNDDGDGKKPIWNITPEKDEFDAAFGAGLNGDVGTDDTGKRDDFEGIDNNGQVPIWKLGSENDKLDSVFGGSNVAGNLTGFGGDDGGVDDWLGVKGEFKPWNLEEGKEVQVEDVFDIGDVSKVEGSNEVELKVEQKEETVVDLVELQKEEEQLMKVLKGPNRAFGDLIAASGITDDMLDSLIALKDFKDIEGLPPLTEIEDQRYANSLKKSSRYEMELQKQEEMARSRVRQVDEKGRAYGTGRRKCSIARVWIEPGEGKFLVNDKDFDVYFPMLDHRAALLRPFSETQTLGLWDVKCTVKGGGTSGQVGAIRLGVSRALQNWEPGLRPSLREAGFLTRDPRVVERKKPGKAKARKSFQWVKR